ncbi:MAG TPA: GGDEF-domain containing protein, partial [Gammaproteobacteria bacterium]|nr:GGDEF-domain containing protein [Gammaproteobacteria bacterium]
MTLFRQLLIFTLILFFLLFAGTWVALIQGTRTFLAEQLASHAQDTATSFGLSIVPHVAEGDYATVDTMMNVVFDRGYYKTMRVTDIEGNEKVIRDREIKVDGVPEWFINFVPLGSPSATSSLTAGWIQAGEVYVESNPGYAYKEFWNIAKMMTIWFILMGLMVAILGGMGIRFLLKPLRRVEQQAEALSKRQYIIQETIPRTRELRSVVLAMNQMTNKVRSMFEKQAAVAERLQKQAYRDELTGLGNRRFFDGQVKPRLERKDANIKGALLLVQVHNLQVVNKEKGYQAGDTLVQRVAELLDNATRPYGKIALARFGGGDFGIFMPDVTPSVAEGVASDIMEGFHHIASENLALTENVGHIGGVLYTQSATLGALLSEADNMLRKAQEEGANRWSFGSLSDVDDKAPQGKEEWRETLDEVLKNEDLTLYAQTVVKTANREEFLHREIFSRVIREDGHVISAGVFMPLAQRLGVVSSLDRIVIKKAMQLTREQVGTDELAVNVSMMSLQDSSFLEWVFATLEKAPQNLPKLVFEFVEYSAVQNLDT